MADPAAGPEAAAVFLTGMAVSQPRGAHKKLTPRAREGITRVVADSNQRGGWSGALFWAGARYGEAGTQLADALADLLPAAAPWNAHEAKRAEMHITNGWHRGAEETA